MSKPRHFPPYDVKDKASIRRYMLGCREMLGEETHRTLSWQVANSVRRALGSIDGGMLALYVAIKNEPDVLSLLAEDLCRQRFTLCLPRVAARGNPMVFNTYNPSYPFGHDALGLSCGDGPEVQPDVFVVPCVAFDKTGRRLGYGGGYYDRTLAQVPNAFKIGVAFGLQEVTQSLPEDAHDMRMDCIATEHGVVQFKKGS